MSPQERPTVRTRGPMRCSPRHRPRSPKTDLVGPSRRRREIQGEHGELGAVVGDSAVPAVAGWGEGPPLRFYFFSARLSLIN